MKLCYIIKNSISFLFATIFLNQLLTLNQKKYQKISEDSSQQVQGFSSFLPDNNNDGYSDFNDFQLVWKNKELSTEDLNELFSIIDKNNDGQIDQNEYQSFYKLFIFPFNEVCDSDHTYILDEGKLRNCLQNLKQFQNITSILQQDQYQQNFKRLIVLLGQGQAANISVNFRGYLFLRRASISWSECSLSQRFITREEIQDCAMTIMNPNIKYNQNHIQYIFNVEQNLDFPQSVDENGDISFLGFVNLFIKYNQYNKFENYEYNNGQIRKKELQKAIQNNLIPNQYLNSKVLDKVFGSEPYYQLDFQSFFILMNLQDIMNIYDESNQGGISFDQFERIQNEQAISKIVQNCLNSSNLDVDEQQLEQINKKYKHENFSQFDYDENYDYEDQESKEQLNYFVPQQFLQVNSIKKSFLRNSQNFDLNKGIQQKQNDQKTLQLSQEPQNQNSKPEQIIFDLLDIQSQNMIDLGDLFNLYKYSYLFWYFDNDDIENKRYLIYSEYLQQKISTFRVPIQPTNQDIQKIKKLINYEEYIPINFVQFLEFFKYQEIFNNLQEKDDIPGILEISKFINAFQKFGFPIIQDDLNYSQYIRKLQDNKFIQCINYDRAFKLAMRTYSRWIKEKEEHQYEGNYY